MAMEFPKPIYRKDGMVLCPMNMARGTMGMIDIGMNMKEGNNQLRRHERRKDEWWQDFAERPRSGW